MAGWITNMRGVVTKLGVGTSRAANTGGKLSIVRYRDIFTNPLAPLTNTTTGAYLVAAVAAPADAAGSDLTILTAGEASLRSQPRNVAIVASATQTEKVTVTGTDQFGASQTEEISFNGSTVVPGTKVWGSISVIHCAQKSGDANIAVGLGSILGTSRRVLGLGLDGGVYVTANGITTSVQETTRPVKSTTAGVYGVTFDTALDATKSYIIDYLSDEAR